MYLTHTAERHQHAKPKVTAVFLAGAFGFRRAWFCVRPTWVLTNEVQVLCRKITVEHFDVIRR